jgi:hypothetical protein
MPRYHLEITGNERSLLLYVLVYGNTRDLDLEVFGKMEADEPHATAEALMHRLLEAPKLREEQAMEPRTERESSAPAVSSARGAGAISPTAPERDNTLVGELTITPTKVEQAPDGKSMLVYYRIRNGQGAVRQTKSHCWDSAQFGNILETLGKSTTFLTKMTKTGFVNIIGVKR